MNPQYKYLYVVSALMLLSGAALALTKHVVFDFIYLGGALGLLMYFLLAPLRSELTVRLRRLVNMSIFASGLFILSAVARLGLLDSYGQGLWILFLALGLVSWIYANVVGLYLRDEENNHSKRKKNGKKTK